MCCPLVLFLDPCNTFWSVSNRKYSRLDVPFWLSNICRPRLFFDKCFVQAKYKSCKDIIIIIKLYCPGYESIPGRRNILQITSFLTLVLNMSGELHDPAALPPGMTRYPLNRRLGNPQSRYGGFWRRKLFLPAENRTSSA
jgi:hypothetical protein